jgi:hypothetical protein
MAIVLCQSTNKVYIYVNISEYKAVSLNKIKPKETYDILLQTAHVRVDPISPFHVISYKQKKHWKLQQTWTQYPSVGRRLAERFEL